MNIPNKKLKSGFMMPEFGIGTYRMGGKKKYVFEVSDMTKTVSMAKSFATSDDIKAIKSAIDLGVTHIDTAEIYSQGHAEEFVRQAIKGHDRSKLFITSKVFPNHFSYDDVISACKNSLKRLKTDYLDLYLLHAYNPTVSLKKTISALDELVKQGLIRHIGVSNFNTEELKEAQKYAQNKIVCNQVRYNLIFRGPEINGLLDYCQNNDVILSAFRPFEKGDLINQIPDIMQQMTNKYKKTPAQIAINWLMSQSNVVTLVKSRSIEHLKDNLGAVGWYMDKEDIEILRKEFPGQQRISTSGQDYKLIYT